jgi:hypothetical protein
MSFYQCDRVIPTRVACRGIVVILDVGLLSCRRLIIVRVGRTVCLGGPLRLGYPTSRCPPLEVGTACLRLRGSFLGRVL